MNNHAEYECRRDLSSNGWEHGCRAGRSTLTKRDKPYGWHELPEKGPRNIIITSKPGEILPFCQKDIELNGLLILFSAERTRTATPKARAIPRFGPSPIFCGTPDEDLSVQKQGMGGRLRRGEWKEVNYPHGSVKKYKLQPQI